MPSFVLLLESFDVGHGHIRHTLHRHHSRIQHFVQNEPLFVVGPRQVRQVEVGRIEARPVNNHSPQPSLALFAVPTLILAFEIVGVDIVGVDSEAPVAALYAQSVPFQPSVAPTEGFHHFDVVALALQRSLEYPGGLLVLFVVVKYMAHRDVDLQPVGHNLDQSLIVGQSLVRVHFLAFELHHKAYCQQVEEVPVALLSLGESLEAERGR